MEDPRVKEAIQKLQTGEASEEDARIAFEAGYKGGPKTQEYYKELGLLDEQPTEPPVETTPESEINPTPDPDRRPPQDALPAETPAETTTPAETIPAEQSATPAKTNSTRETVSDVISRWTPVVAQTAASVTPFGGVDPTGEAAGSRALAAQSQKTAGDLSKIVQWNKQRATDNTLADKIAAAQASGKWKQNANALGAEGGASVVASQNEAVTPDIMAQKQYQSQSMGAAGQTLTEADKHKRKAISNETNANRADYFSGYNEALNDQATNIATANGQQNPPKEEKKPEPAKPEEKKSEPVAQTQPETEKKTEPAEQEQTPVHQAETNQQTDSVDTATQIASDNQQLEDLIHRAEGINTARRSGVITPTQESNYRAIEAQFNELANKMGGAPRSLPPLYVEESKPEDKFNSDEYKNQPAVVDPELSRINPELLYSRYGQ